MKKNFLNKVAALAMTVCMAVTPAVPVMPVQAKAVTATTKSTVVKKYVKVNKVAPKANKKVRDAFNKLGFKIHVNSTVKNYTGYFNARDRKITLIASVSFLLAIKITSKLSNFILHQFGGLHKL